MKCPFCEGNEDRVLDSRERKHGTAIRRRRECLKCGKRFTTYERIESIPIMVVKKDQRREVFDNQKIINGLLKASEKRPIPLVALQEIVDNVEQEINDRPSKKEISTVEIGEMVMEKLAHLDDVAYVRFASVYRQFRDISQFMSELQEMLEQRNLKDIANTKG